MAEVVTMLALSPTMEEGTLAAWTKQEGDTIDEGEVLAEVETDKATMDMESFFEGTILKLLAEPGDAIRVGAAMAIIGEAGEDISDLLAEVSGGAPAAPAAQDADEAPAQAEAEAAPAPVETPAADTSTDDGGRRFVSPVARRMAEDRGVDLSALTGSGPHGRIIKRDIEEALASGARPAAAPSKPAQTPAAKPAAPALTGEPVVVGDMPDAGGEGRPLSQMRKTIARRMTQVWQATPHFVLTTSFDMAPLMQRRAEFNAELKAAGVEAKISVNDMIIKATALALKRYPRANVAYNGDEMVYFDRVHIGVAVAVEDGLITPTIRDADTKSLTTISAEIRDLATRARDKKLKPHEYGGSTFSISNLGMYGIDHFQAIINPPEAAILAIGAVKKLPVVVDDALTIGTRMNITMSCDHRAIDGAIGAEFL